MLGDIFYTECLGCRERRDDFRALCPVCRDALKVPPAQCQNCGHPLHVEAAYCGHCSGGKQFDRVYADYVYTGTVRELIKAVKFRYHLLGLKEFSAICRFTPEDGCVYDMVVSVPSHITRRFRRFTHPAEVLARTAAERGGVPVIRGLKRIRRTRYQYRLKGEERKKNIRGAFTASADVSGKRILLVDDIMTTGATLNECARVLKRAGAAGVDCYVLAVTMR